MGFITAATLAIVQFWPDLTPLLKVSGVLISGMAIDTAFLSPRFVGQKVGLHPVWLIFALFVFSYLFGLVGTLIAVPLAAATGGARALCRAGLPRQLRLQGQRCGAGRPREAQGDGMTGAPDQLILDLPHRPALGAEDFLISGSNQAAADIVDRWPDWPHRSVVVVAPPGAGKTHLANVWRLKSGAARVRGRRA